MGLVLLTSSSPAAGYSSILGYKTGMAFAQGPELSAAVKCTVCRGDAQATPEKIPIYIEGVIYKQSKYPT